MLRTSKATSGQRSTHYQSQPDMQMSQTQAKFGNLITSLNYDTTKMVQTASQFRSSPDATSSQGRVPSTAAKHYHPSFTMRLMTRQVGQRGGNTVVY